MTTREVFYFLLLAIAVTATGFVWLFGPYGLIGGGVAVAALALTADEKPKEDGDG